MADPWYRALYAIDSRSISAALFARVAIAVALPLFGFVLAGHTQAGVAGGATAMFVTLSDIGATRRGRAGTMFAAMLAILFGGFVGDKFGGTTWTDEIFILGSAFVAGWVSNSHPGISAIARFGALATAAGAGMQVPDPIAVFAVIAGGASAIAVAYALWLIRDTPPDQNVLDWRTGVRRAFAGADAGWWFAFCYAVACAIALLAADHLGLHTPYWATFTVIMVMRREGTVSLQLAMLYMAGTLAGVPAAALLAHLSEGSVVAHAALATLAAACGRLGFALNPALGYMAFTVFLIMIVELARGDDVAPFALVLTRLYDVGVGCAIALVATRIAALGRRENSAAPGKA